MKGLGKRQRKNRSKARVSVRAVAVKRFASESERLQIRDAAIAGIAFHPSDGEPCACWGDSIDWKVSPFTREQLLSLTSAQLLHLTRAQLRHI